MTREIPIREEYRRPLQWFPDHGGQLDAAITALVREQIEAAMAIRKPTLLRMSEALGLDRERLARLIERLDLGPSYRERKAADFRQRRTERAEARAAARADSADADADSAGSD